MKTSKLTGAALDWAVAKCEGMDYISAYEHGNADEYFGYSTDWVQGGLIIEREKLGVWFSENSVDEEGNLLGVAEWYAEDKGGDHVRTGATPLIAAMRVYVASKLGDEVEIPKEFDK